METKKWSCYFIGKSNWPNEPNANAIYDDLKIFNGALDSSAVYNEFVKTNVGIGKAL